MKILSILKASFKIKCFLNSKKSNYQKINNFICIIFKKNINKKEIKNLSLFLYQNRVLKIRTINRKNFKLAYIKFKNERNSI